MKNLLFNKELVDIIRNNLEIFIYEFKSISEDDWKEFESDINCGSCIANISKHLKKDIDLTNSIFSFIMKEEVSIYFRELIDSPIVQEFNSVLDMELFLRELKNHGSIIKTVNVSPNGKGGYIMVVM